MVTSETPLGQKMTVSDKSGKRKKLVEVTTWANYRPSKKLTLSKAPLVRGSEGIACVLSFAELNTAPAMAHIT
jgi:hypothetical protein